MLYYEKYLSGSGAGAIPTIIAIVKNVVGAGLLPLPQTLYTGTPMGGFTVFNFKLICSLELSLQIPL